MTIIDYTDDFVKDCVGPSTHFGCADNRRIETGSHRFSEDHSSGFEFIVVLSPKLVVLPSFKIPVFTKKNYR